MGGASAAIFTGSDSTVRAHWTRGKLLTMQEPMLARGCVAARKRSFAGEVRIASSTHSPGELRRLVSTERTQSDDCRLGRSPDEVSQGEVSPSSSTFARPPWILS